jgi:hypothetical protein
MRDWKPSFTCEVIRPGRPFPPMSLTILQMVLNLHLGSPVHERLNLRLPASCTILSMSNAWFSEALKRVLRSCSVAP